MTKEQLQAISKKYMQLSNKLAPKNEEKSIFYKDFSDWILENIETIDDDDEEDELMDIFKEEYDDDGAWMFDDDEES